MKTTVVPNIQKVEKVDLIQSQDSSLKMEQSVSLIEQIDSSTLVAELLVCGIALCLSNENDGNFN